MSDQVSKAAMPQDSYCAQLLNLLKGNRHQPVLAVACADIMPRGDLERELRNNGLGLYTADVAMYRNEWPGIRLGSRMIEGILYQSRISDQGTLTRSVRTTGSRSDACALYYGSVTYVRHVALDGWIKSAEDIAAAIAYVDAEIFIPDPVCYEHARYDYGFESLLATRGVASPLDVAQKLLGNDPSYTRNLWQELWSVAPNDMAQLMAALTQREERRLESMRGCAADMVVLKGLSAPPTSELNVRLARDYDLPLLAKACAAYQDDGHIVAIDVSGMALDRTATAHGDGATIGQAAGLDAAEIVDLYEGLAVDVAYGVMPDVDGYVNVAPYKRLSDEIVLWASVPRSVLQQGPSRTEQYVRNILQAGDKTPLVVDLWDCGMSRTLDVSERNVLGESVAAVLNMVVAVT